MTRILVVDQHPIVREGVAATLSDEPSIEIVGGAESGEGAIAESERLDPDMIVMDIRLAGMSGIEASRSLRLRKPGIKIVLLTGDPTAGVLTRALATGAQGLVFKRSELSELKKAVSAVSAGMTYVDPDLARRIRSTSSNRNRGPFDLTLTEMRVLEYLVQGLTNSEIGEGLGLSQNTIKTHLRNAMHKLRAKDRAHAAAIAVREGLA